MPPHMGFLRQRYKKVSTDTTATHYSNQVDNNERWYLAVLAFSPGTTDNADLIVSIDGHGYDHVIGSKDTMLGGEWYFIRPQCWLEANERLKFDWDGVVSSEVLEVHVSGHVRYLRRSEDD